MMPGGGEPSPAFSPTTRRSDGRATPEEFGHGSPEGIAAPEAANNTVACTALVPMLSLGIPSSNSSAVLLGGFLMHGLIPGPLLFVSHADVVHGLYVGMFAGNIAMLIIGYLIMSPCMWLVNRPKPYLMAFIYALVVSGVYAIQNSIFHVGLTLAFGVLGSAMKSLQAPGAADGARCRARLRRRIELPPRARDLERRLPHVHPGPDCRRSAHRRLPVRHWAPSSARLREA